jgi:exopolysaccharide biosynthesis polyprenyl glycosylphosphotransferase
LYFGFVVLFIGTFLGVYRVALHDKLGRQRVLAGKAYLLAIILVFASLSIFQYNDYPRRFVFLFFLVLPICFSLLRGLFLRLNTALQDRGYGYHNVLLAGYDNGGMKVVQRFKSFPELGYRIKGMVSCLKEQPFHSVDIQGITVPIYAVHQLAHIIEQERIDRIFVPSPTTITNGYCDVLPTCKKKQVKLKVLSEESDRLLRLARVYDIAGITLYAPRREKIDSFKETIKRLFDIGVAITALILLFPILLCTAIAIGIESGFPVFFKQRRASIKGGKTFDFYKFRSMVKNADELKESLFDLNESNGALFKIKNDPRLTNVGKVIRKYSIDELPQLINVLKGDMSIVGPRPLPFSDFEKANESTEFWESVKDRERLKPGITGLWQISGRSDIEFREMMWLDLYYVENQSLLFDLEICFATIPALVFGKGAY